MLRIKSKDQVDRIFGACQGVVNMRVAAGVDVPDGLHYVMVHHGGQHMGFGVDGWLPGGVFFGTMSKVLHTSGPTWYQA
jgi:hypothetical protein